MSGTLGRALALGVVTGIRSSAGFVALTRSRRVPDASVLAADSVRRLAYGALAGETLADKTGLLPSRTDPLPWVARTLLGGAAAWLMAPGSTSSRPAAAVVGSLSAAATTWLVTSARSAARAHHVSDLIPALGEDLVVARLVRSFQPRCEEVA